MTEIARWMARVTWWQLLRFQRIPWVKRSRRWWLRAVPATTARRMIRQDRFARRHGQAVLTFSFTLMLASVAVTGCYFLALAFVTSGIINRNP